MARRSTSQLAYQAIRIEGCVIPADELARLTTLQAPDKTEQTEPHYGVPKGLKLRDEIARFWRIAQNQSLDEATDRFGELNPETNRTRRRSPFMLAQEALNASDHSLWALVSNGLTLRVLRDNPSLTRPAYVEVDLESLFSEELYADFTAFWLLAHASRFGKTNAEPSDCPWERWRGAGQEAGVRARDRLRDGVAEALRALGTGFLRHPANSALRAALQGQNGVTLLPRQAFFEQLLSLVYRFIFLATVEDRIDSTTGQSLVFAPGTQHALRQRYMTGYSLAHRQLLHARQPGTGAHQVGAGTRHRRHRARASRTAGRCIASAHHL